MDQTTPQPMTEPEDDETLESLETSDSTNMSPVDDDAAGSLEFGKPDNDGSAIDATRNKDGGSSLPTGKHTSGIKSLLLKFNIYLLLFILLLTIAGVIIGVAYFQSKKQSSAGIVQTQNLSAETLKQLASSQTQVGDAKQVLSIQSNAIFAGKVLVRDSLEVAGNIQVGGTVSLSSLTVTGLTNFEQTQVGKNLSVGGDTALQGTLSVQKSLQVNGGGTFNGPLAAPQITTSVLQLNGDLTLTHHIVAGGATPNRSNGPALGSGGTSSVSGSDTSGTLSVNTGNGPGAGCFATINFTQKYNGTPHVIVTPVGPDAGATDFYVSRNSGSFSICDASPPPPGASFAFDYFVVD
ncbi:MAG: hypothetical protein ABI602_04155 [Candidatus Saccharibacteria bacterium]